MPKTLAAEYSSKTLNPTLLALKPRPVLLSRGDMGKKEAGEKESKTLNSKPDQKVLLLRSIAQHLDRCGFSKCLKKFLSEAEIEKKDLDSSLPDLEEIYCEYLKKRDLETGDSIKQETEGIDKIPDKQILGKKEEENASDNYEGKKDKKKKKKEPKSELILEKSKDGSSENKKETGVEIGEGQKDKKKKKKLKSGESESLDDDKTHRENGAEKVSKKRKRPETEEENKPTIDDKEDEESKRRKKDDSVDVNGVLETPTKQPDVPQNGNVENTGEKSANQKSGKKQLNSSKEPKKPFQRVNVEEVEFFDEKLKDNSYWAKDGADSGYGAKAQEVLGQVRGKDFRHEKTKKKRGSYRGGLIDMDSHSVKFNYSDEE